jgi:hypothetical protein
MILVPGSARMARGSQRERLVRGMIAASEGVNVDRVEAPDIPSGVARMHARAGSAGREIDVVEAYWNDLVPSPDAAGVRARVVRGTSLLIYWGFSGVWRGFRNRKYLTLGLISGGIALLTWYYGTLAMFLQAFLSDDSAPAVLRSALAPVLPLVNAVGTWKIWALSSVVMGLIPVHVLVGMMDMTKRYLTNERADGEGTGLRTEVRHRVREQMLAAMAAGPYSRLTVVGHSFGSVVALDVLADLPLPSGAVRFVTIGSPIELLKRRAAWLPVEVSKCLNRLEIALWIDICSDGDWFASGSDLPPDARTRSLRVPIEGTFVDMVYGRTHRGYFDRDEVVALLLDAPAVR